LSGWRAGFNPSLACFTTGFACVLDSLGYAGLFPSENERRALSAAASIRSRPDVNSLLLCLELETRDVPTFLGNQVFPLDNPWNQVIANAPVAANSAAIISAIDARHGGTPPHVHPDFGNPATDGALYGIPINVVTSSTPAVSVLVPTFGYPDESDLVPVPIPANAVIEGDGPSGPSDPSDPAARGDSHLLVYDRTANVLYELVSAARPNEASYPTAAPNRLVSGARIRSPSGT